MTEPAAGPAGPGTVVLELGADIGALILYTPADMDGAEIEISRDDEPGAPSGRTRRSAPRQMADRDHVRGRLPGPARRAVHDLA